MKRLLPLLLIALALAFSFGCGDDDNPVNEGPTAKCDDTSPNNAYKVVNTDILVEVVDSGNFPAEYIDLLEEALAELFGGTENTQWNVIQSALILTRTETPLCAPMGYVYNPLSLSCTVPLPIDLDEDVSALDLCAPFPNPIPTLPDIEVCLTDISITATIIPDLVWSADFSAFSGTETISSVGNPADVTVSLTVAGVPFGPYSFTFHASRTVNGTCCATCKPCP